MRQAMPAQRGSAARLHEGLEHLTAAVAASSHQGLVTPHVDRDVPARPGAPTPDLPRGAGGPPLRRAAGRDTSAKAVTPEGVVRGDRPAALGSPAAAVVLEPDPLLRLLVVPAAAALGFTVAGETATDAPGRVAAAFVPLGQQGDCRRACAAARGGGPPSASPLVVGYGVGPAPLLAAHRAHGCADLVLQLGAVAGRPCFIHLPAADAVTAAGLTPREADVLVLLLGGLTTTAVAARLRVSASTARSHCRAVLRKLEAGDRRALRARLLAGPVSPPSAAPVIALPRFA